MIALLLSLAFVLFLLSLPFPKAKASSALRRAGALLVLLALSPFTVLVLYRSLAECAAANSGSFATVAAVVLLSVVAYIALKVRRFLARPPGAPRRRSMSGKRLVIEEPVESARPPSWDDFPS
jgi:hypothetical protein